MNCQCANTEFVIVGALTTESHLIHDAFMREPSGSNLSAMSSSFAPQSILEKLLKGGHGRFKEEITHSSFHK